MIAARTSLNNKEILIETLGEQVELVGQAAGRQTEVTGIEDNLRDAYERAKQMIGGIASDFAASFKEKLATAQKVELEFSLGLSSTSGLWVISAKGEAALKVRMTWDGSHKEE